MSKLHDDKSGEHKHTRTDDLNEKGRDDYNETHHDYQLEKNSGVSVDVNNYKSAKIKDRHLWRDLVAYWILGLCNNYGYVVMLSAAHDIIEQFNKQNNEPTKEVDSVHVDSGRYCHILSTGTILLADIIPALVIKSVIPFVPFWANVQVISAVSLSVSGFLLVGFAQTEFLAILGVVLTSASSGLGETTFLAYSSKYNKNVVSTWSSGTGGAGIAGSLSYAALKSINVSQKMSMIIMLIVPICESIAFWILLRKPSNIILPTLSDTDSSLESTDQSNAESTDDEKPLTNFADKLRYCIFLLKYMIPLTTVYIFEYFINQGLFELVYFKDIFLDKASQYRWLNVDYQIGVFISRSTVNLVTIDRIWLMSVFQFINVIYFLFEVIYYITPSIWIVFAIVFWEGLLGGGAYVNTFYRISKEISPARRRFAMGIVTLADSSGIAIAGFSAIPVHNAICSLAAPLRHYWL